MEYLGLCIHLFCQCYQQTFGAKSSVRCKIQCARRQASEQAPTARALRLAAALFLVDDRSRGRHRFGSSTQQKPGELQQPSETISQSTYLPTSFLPSFLTHLIPCKRAESNNNNRSRINSAACLVGSKNAAAQDYNQRARETRTPHQPALASS